MTSYALSQVPPIPPIVMPATAQSVATAIVDDEIARYESAGGLSAAQRNVLEQLKAGIDVGMTADDAGEMVVNAVENDRFWAFPNAEEFFGPAESEWARVQDCRKPL